jgi:endonuclease-3
VAPTIALLKKHYPDAHCELNHRNAFELLVATILSAQCTDERVNKVTPALFEKYPDPKKLADSSQEDVEELIRTCGFYRSKAKNIRGTAQALVEKHKGQVPANMGALVELPGVGRKTANCVLGNVFNIPTGVVVDTHVARLSFRLGWTKSDNPVVIEQELMKIIPKEDWILLAHLLIFHGRRICKARKPLCEQCFLFDLCPKRGVK